MHTAAVDADPGPWDPGPAVTMLPSLLKPTERPLPKPSCSCPVGVVVVMLVVVVPEAPEDAAVVTLAEPPLPTVVIEPDGSVDETSMQLIGWLRYYHIASGVHRAGYFLVHSVADDSQHQQRLQRTGLANKRDDSSEN